MKTQNKFLSEKAAATALVGEKVTSKSGLIKGIVTSIATDWPYQDGIWYHVKDAEGVLHCLGEVNP